ncbi:MAG: hypothetical protein HZY76_19670 [Anaerolineae bacterium]|nr:MAG: hypothetical protein HZY76_19670 [Anaerolineae bacterium]
MNLDVATAVTGPAFQFGAALNASRAWAPPGRAVTYTLTLASNAGTAALAQTGVTLTLPSALGNPTALGGSLTPPQFDPLTRRVTWNGPVYFQQPVTLTVTTVVAPDPRPARRSCCPAACVMVRAVRTPSLEHRPRRTRRQL